MVPASVGGQMTGHARQSGEVARTIPENAGSRWTPPLNHREPRSTTPCGPLWQRGASIGAVAQHPVLLNLAAVVERLPTSASDDTATRAELARQEIVAACHDLSDTDLAVEARFYDEGDAALIALGLATGYRSAPLARRRPAVAGKLEMKADTAWKERPGRPSHVQRLIATVADQILAREARHRMRTAGLLRPKRDPSSPR